MSILREHPYRGPGWRVTRTFNPGRPGDWWRAEAMYAHPLDLPVNAPQPAYFYFDDGPTEAEAKANVLARCAKDKDWPLMLETSA